MEVELSKVLRELLPKVDEAADRLESAFFSENGVQFDEEGALIDREVETLICTWLASRYEGMGIQAEELLENQRAASPGNPYVWYIDPHDGTTAAAAGYRGATLSIGLVRDGDPVLGVVCAYASPTGRRDTIAWCEGMSTLSRNGRPHAPTAAGQPVALVSKHADRYGPAYSYALKPYRYITSPGIAYRLARVAAGDAAVAISLSRPRDFDCVGGHALLIGAGLDLYDERCRPIRYTSGGHEQFIFCFGGSLSHCQAMAAVEWQPVFRATQVENGPLEPDPAELVSQCAALQRAQGALVSLLVGHLESAGSETNAGTESISLSAGGYAAWGSVGRIVGETMAGSTTATESSRGVPELVALAVLFADQPARQLLGCLSDLTSTQANDADRSLQVTFSLALHALLGARSSLRTTLEYLSKSCSPLIKIDASAIKHMGRLLSLAAVFQRDSREARLPELGSDMDSMARALGAAEMGVHRLPQAWLTAVLTARHEASSFREPDSWPVDVLVVAERLLARGGRR